MGLIGEPFVKKADFYKNFNCFLFPSKLINRDKPYNISTQTKLIQLVYNCSFSVVIQIGIPSYEMPSLQQSVPSIFVYIPKTTKNIVLLGWSLLAITKVSVLFMHGWFKIHYFVMLASPDDFYRVSQK